MNSPHDADHEKQLPLNARRSSLSTTAMTNYARCFSRSHSSFEGGRKNPVARSIMRKLRRLRTATDRHDVVLARRECIQIVRDHLQRVGDLGSISRLIVAGV